MLFMIIAQNMHYFQKIIFQRMHQNVLQRFYKSKTQLMIFTKSNNLLLSWFWVLKMFVKRFLAKNWLSAKISQNLHSPVDGRTCLIDQPIDRPASTDKTESKIVARSIDPVDRSRWVIDRGKYCALKIFKFVFPTNTRSIHPVDRKIRTIDRPHRPTLVWQH